MVLSPRGDHRHQQLCLLRIPAAIVETRASTCPGLRGSSITSMAVKAAVKEAIELAGYNVDDFSKEVTLETSNEVIEEEADVVIMGAGTSGLTCACRLLELAGVILSGEAGHPRRLHVHDLRRREPPRSQLRTTTTGRRPAALPWAPWKA